MSTGELIVVDQGKVVIALRTLQLNLRRQDEMLRRMGERVIRSFRTNILEQGSPAGSFVPLAASTIKRNPEYYGPGHKILVGKAILFNSFTYAIVPSGVRVGTDVIYAAVHNFGSHDRGGSVGPQAKIDGRGVQVKSTSRTIKLARQKETVRVKGKDGVVRTVTRNGPQYTRSFRVGPHTRFQNIPGRPFAVLRPNDPEALRQIAVEHVNKAKQDAGLAGA